jgi:hypothetical protein
MMGRLCIEQGGLGNPFYILIANFAMTSLQELISRCSQKTGIPAKAINIHSNSEIKAETQLEEKLSDVGLNDGDTLRISAQPHSKLVTIAGEKWRLTNDPEKRCDVTLDDSTGKLPNLNIC